MSPFLRSIASVQSPAPTGMFLFTGSLNSRSIGFRASRRVRREGEVGNQEVAVVAADRLPDHLLGYVHACIRCQLTKYYLKDIARPEVDRFGRGCRREPAGRGLNRRGRTPRTGC